LKNRYVAKEMVNGTRETFDYLLCAACGTLYLVKPPADIGPYYASYYSTKNMAASPPIKNSLKKRVKNRLCRIAMKHLGRLYPVKPPADLAPIVASYYSTKNMASPPIKNSFQKRVKNKLRRIAMKHLGGPVSKMLDRWVALPPQAGFQALYRLKLSADDAILDVGCGDGTMVGALDRIGFTHVCGCDPFITQEKTFDNGARLLKSELSGVPGVWDLIMLHHCFEHVPNPAATARMICEKLKPGGLCLLRFPNVDSVEFTRYGENWWGLHAPRHYFLLSQKALKLVWQATGMHIEQIWCDSQPDHYIYSYEYMLNLAETDPGSVRALWDKSPLWNNLERDHIAHNVPWYNEHLIGDWIVYLLRKDH